MALADMYPMHPRVHRIERISKETHDTFTIELDAQTDSRSFKPGQFNMLYMFGTGEVPISISGDPSDPSTIVHTTRSVGSVTRAMKNMKRSVYSGLPANRFRSSGSCVAMP